MGNWNSRQHCDGISARSAWPKMRFCPPQADFSTVIGQPMFPEWKRSTEIVHSTTGQLKLSTVLDSPCKAGARSTSSFWHVVIIVLTSCFNLNYVTERHEHYTTSGRVEDIGVSVASWLLSDIDFTGHSNPGLRHRASWSQLKYTLVCRLLFFSTFFKKDAKTLFKTGVPMMLVSMANQV